MALSIKKIPYYKSKIKANPKDAESHFLLGYIYDTSDEHIEALKSYEAAAAADPGFAQAYINIGFLNALSHNFNTAADQWEKAFLAGIKLNDLLTNSEYSDFYRLKISETEELLQKQILLYPERSDFYYQLGVFQFYFKNPEIALSSFVKAQELNENLTGSYLFCGEIYILLDKCGHAILQLQKALSLNPKLPKAYYDLGLIYQKEGNIKLARMQFEKAVEINDNFFEAHRALGKVYALEGNLDQAIKQFQRSIDLNGHNWQTHFELAKTYDKIYQIDFAVKEYEKVISLNPSAEDAYYNLAIDYKKTGEIEKSVAVFNDLLKINPNNSCAHYQLGTIFLHQEKHDMAARHLEKTLAIHPDDVYALYNLATLYYNMSSFREAAELLNRAISINPDEAEYYNLIGKAYEKLNKNAEAVSSFEKYLTINPANLNLLSHTGILSLKFKNYAKALQIFEKLKETSTDVDNFYFSAVSNYYLNNHDDTLSNLTHALRADNTLAAVHHFMGCVEILYNNNAEKAVEYFNKSLNLKPDFISAIIDLSRVLIKSGQVSQAKSMLSKFDAAETLTDENILSLTVLFAEADEFEKAFAFAEKSLNKDNKNYVVFAVLGYIYRLGKDYANSIKCYEQALALNPDFIYAQSAINSLKANKPDEKTPYFIDEFFLAPYIGLLKEEPAKIKISEEINIAKEIKSGEKITEELEPAGTPAGAEQIFEAYLKNADKPLSSASQTILKLAQAYMELKKFDMASAELEKLINGNIKNKEIITSYAFCKNKMQHYKEAVQILEEAFTKYNEKELLINLINNLSKIDTPEKLKIYSEKALSGFDLSENERKRMKKILNK